LPDVLDKHSNGHLPVLQLDDSRHTFAESCRNLRSSLVFGATNGNRPKVILVTSAVPDEGKSTIAINLATVLALGGSRVLVVDADLRRGHLHKLIGVSGEPGLIECVQRAGDLAQFAVPTPLANLFFLACGKLAQTPDGVFLAPAFDNLIRRAREEYDYIVIDSIPVLAADDSTTLAPKADGVLFVVRRGFTSSRLAQEALDLLYQRQAKIIGIVFNRADSRSRSYKYYKYSKYYPTDEKV
jgi:capsular exopolysaccharide synthesis family protein